MLLKADLKNKRVIVIGTLPEKGIHPRAIDEGR
jgi:hypothetical protein